MLGDSVSLLIHGGHRWVDIQKYSLRQLEAFVEMANRAARHHNIQVAGFLRLAYHAEGKLFQSEMERIEDQDDG